MYLHALTIEPIFWDAVKRTKFSDTIRLATVGWSVDCHLAHFKFGTTDLNLGLWLSLDDLRGFVLKYLMCATAPSTQL